VAKKTPPGALGYICNPPSFDRTFNPAKAHAFPDRASADLYVASSLRKNAHRARNFFVIDHPTQPL
jgi:hypothetical protein